MLTRSWDAQNNNLTTMKLFLLIVLSSLLSGDLIGDALRIKDMKEGRDAAIAEFNDTYLTVRKGSSLMDEPHPMYPDSTYYGSNRLDDNILPLAFGFVPEDVREEVVKNLISTIRKQKYAPKVSPEVEPYVLKTLYETGHDELAYFICDKHPDMVTDTLIDSRYVDEWREKCLAGVNLLPGRKVRVEIKPDFKIQELDSLACSVATPKGEVSSVWTKDLMHTEWDITIPKGAKAFVYAPTASKDKVSIDRRARCIKVEDGRTVWKVKGGRYHFSVDFDLPDYVVEEQFVYKNVDFPQCHGSSLCFAENGDLLSSFYGGTAEHNPDTKARICRKAAGTDTWTSPVAVAEPDKEGWCLDNPVLFRIPEPGEPLLLFYKIRPGFHMKEGDIDISTIYFWEGRLKKSYDNGQTWSEMEKLPDGFLGPVKDKPIYREGRLIVPSSFEHKFHHEGKRIHFELSDDKCATWRKTAPCDVQMCIPTENRVPGRVGENVDNPANPDDYYGVYRPIISIQPTIFIHKDGSLQALCRTGNSKMSCTWSYDNGETWTKEVLTDMPQNGSGLDGTTLPDGRFVLAYNDVETLPGSRSSVRTPLRLAISEDGIHWKNIVDLENDIIKEYSYPAVICDDEGYVHISYTWRRYRVKYVKVKVPDKIPD